MPKFSEVSRSKLDTCDERLQKICEEAIKHVSFDVLQGHVAHDPGAQGQQPSLGFVIIPLPAENTTLGEYFFLAGTLQAIARQQGVTLCWAGRKKKNQNYGRFELKVNG